LDQNQALWMAVLQGATELFPVSSLGHAVVVPALLRAGIDQSAPAFLPFLVMLHLGTAAALLGYFWRDWLALFLGVLGLSRDAHRVNESRRVFVLIVVATIPAVLVGGLLEHFLRGLFGSPIVAAAFLAINGVMLLFGEQIRGHGHRPLDTLTVRDAAVIGCWQCGALIPGISRSGATIVGALLRGVSHEGAAHFSFLIATPIILGATVLELPKLRHADIPPGTVQTALIAAVVSGIVAWLSTAFLMRYFRRNEAWALNPFGYYCIVAGLAATAWLMFR
jgi:undecaprenyl-diphosphatase